jgi:hypothetical protein
MPDLSTTIVSALDLGAGFQDRDPRPAAAAQAFYAHFGVDRLDALAEALWIVIEDPRAQATEVLQAWHVMQSLKAHRKHLQ